MRPTASRPGNDESTHQDLLKIVIAEACSAGSKAKTCRKVDFAFEAPDGSQFRMSMDFGVGIAGWLLAGLYTIAWIVYGYRAYRQRRQGERGANPAGTGDATVEAGGEPLMLLTLPPPNTTGHFDEEAVVLATSPTDDEAEREVARHKWASQW